MSILFELIMRKLPPPAAYSLMSQFCGNIILTWPQLENLTPLALDHLRLPFARFDCVRCIVLGTTTQWIALGHTYIPTTTKKRVVQIYTVQITQNYWLCLFSRSHEKRMRVREHDRSWTAWHRSNTSVNLCVGLRFKQHGVYPHSVILTKSMRKRTNHINTLCS